MRREEAIKIIHQEKLKGFNLNENRYNRVDEVVIKSKDGVWMVYVTDERASAITGSKMIFNNEEDAWDNFIVRLRADKRLRESREQ